MLAGPDKRADIHTCCKSYSKRQDQAFCKSQSHLAVSHVRQYSSRGLRCDAHRSSSAKINGSQLVLQRLQVQSNQVLARASCALQQRGVTMTAYSCGGRLLDRKFGMLLVMCWVAIIAQKSTQVIRCPITLPGKRCAKVQ